jgi:hypothetical protein
MPPLRGWVADDALERPAFRRRRWRQQIGLFESPDGGANPVDVDRFCPAKKA